MNDFCLCAVYNCITGSLYRCLFSADDKLTPNVEYRPQRSYNRSAIETTRTSSIASIFSKKLEDLKYYRLKSISSLF